MQLGMVGLGRMGANMTRRLMRGGHQLVVSDLSADAVKSLADEGAGSSSSLEDLIAKLAPPRAVWVMVPAGSATEQTVQKLAQHMQAGDAIIDGGNSYFKDDVRRAGEFKGKGIHYVDVGTSGGVWGIDRGYCMMIGGPNEAVQRLDPIFKTLAPGVGDIPRTPGREKLGGTAEQGYIHCGASGSGHFVKMVHNGIEYGIMQAYAEASTFSRTPPAKTCRKIFATISTCPISPRFGGGAAWSVRGCSISRLWLSPKIPRYPNTRATCRIPVRDAGRFKRRSKKQYPRKC